MRMGLIGVAALAALLIAGQAMAADSPKDGSAAPFNWTGLYVGANFGGGWSSNTANMAPVSTDFRPVFAAGDVATPGVDASGAFGGVQAGYNYQVCPFGFFGIETDLQGASITGTGLASTTGAAGFAPEVTTVDQRLSWFGTLRARIGYIPINRLAIYGTGGLAYGATNYSANIAFPPIPQLYSGASSDTRAGWTVGGGVEYFFCNNVSVKAEYLFINLGSDTVLIGPVIGPRGFASATFDQTDNIFRIGMNYKFF
jgi:outer membrane immunogenic protein